MRKRVVVLFSMAGLTILLGACGGAASSTTGPTVLSIAGPTQFTSVGQTGQLVVNAIAGGVATQDSAGQCSWNSSNPGVATVTSPGGLVTAVSSGATTITVSACGTVTSENPTATLGVTVALTAQAYEGLNGKYVGVVTSTSAVQGSALPPCVSSGAEIVMINVDVTGVGTLAASDSITRQYAILIPPGLAFTSQGTFLDAGVSLSGQIAVTIPVIASTAIAYQETFMGAACQNVLRGTLTKQ